MASNVRLFNLFIDGHGYAGKADELTPPKLALKTESHRTGGMDAEVERDVGMEKLEASYSLIEFDSEAQARFGLTNGYSTTLTFRVAEDDGSGTPVGSEYVMRGVIKENDQGSVKAGGKATLKQSMACVYYKYTRGGRVIHEIDTINGVRIINGTDQLAAFRQLIS